MLAARSEAREAVVTLAKQFGQGAIFEYSAGKTPGTLQRMTVPALSGEVVREAVSSCPASCVCCSVVRTLKYRNIHG